MTVNFLKIFLIAIIATFVHGNIHQNESHFDKTCYGNICIESDYSIDLSPNRKDGKPIIVDMKYRIDGITSVDCDLNIVGLQLSLQMSWMDNRVSAKDEKLVEDGAFISAPKTLYMEPDSLPKVWIPSIWVYSMTEFDLKTTLTDQALLSLSREERFLNKSNKRMERHASPDEIFGYFLAYEIQFDLYVKCNMKYHQFPFDKHLCYVNITSSDLNANILRFATTPDPSWRNDKTDFKSTRYFDAKILPLETYENETIYENSVWSITGFKLELKRRRAEYVFNYICTSALCVIVSWTSFLMPSKDANARTAIFITMILVWVTIFNSAMEKTPTAANGTTALIIWLLSMFMFIFVAFLGYCIALIVEKRNFAKKKKTQSNEVFESQDNSVEEVVKGGKNGVKTSQNLLKNKTTDVDLIILTILSLLFAFYVVLYGLVYTTSSSYSNN